MASRNSTSRGSKAGSAAQRSKITRAVSSSNASTNMVTRKMGKAIATTSCPQIERSSVKSLENPKFGPKSPAELKGTASKILKQHKDVDTEENLDHINPTSAPSFLVEDGFSSEDSVEISSHEDELPHETKQSTNQVLASVMMVEAGSVEEQLADMKKLLDKFQKDSEEKDAQIKRQNKQIALLTKKLGKKKVGEFSDKEDSSSEDGSSETSVYSKPNSSKKEGNPASTINMQDIQDMIASALKLHIGGGPQVSHRYTKPYTKRIDAMRTPFGYQPPKFQQFDGKGNPKQHVAHFIETCNTAGTEGDLLVKQFVRSLKGIAFDWYTDLTPESIDSWEQMEGEFLNRFYSTRRTVSMTELTNTKQWKDEPVIDYINRWRALCLECKDRLTEVSAVEMCIQGMQWSLVYILQGIKPRTFQELATKAHDMELTIANHGAKFLPTSEPRNEKKEFRKNDRSSKGTKESMNITSAPIKISTKPKSKAEKASTSKNFERKKPTLKELQAKKYPFPDSDLSGMLDDLLDKGVIELPPSKHPKEAGRTTDPSFCRYHRVVSHPIEKCITLKEKIMQLAKDGHILLDVDETVESNHAAAVFGPADSCQQLEENEMV